MSYKHDKLWVENGYQFLCIIFTHVRYGKGARIDCQTISMGKFFRRK